MSLLMIPFMVQMLVIGIDEFHFHWKRGLPKWERIGHPLDTLTVLACFLFILFFPYSALHLKIYIGIALFSCLFVTKDEFVHKECCPAKEQWLHALLFLNHPVVLTAAALLWPEMGAKPFLRYFISLQALFIGLFSLYQIVYWNYLWKEEKR